MGDCGWGEDRVIQIPDSGFRGGQQSLEVGRSVAPPSPPGEKGGRRVASGGL